MKFRLFSVVVLSSIISMLPVSARGDAVDIGTAGAFGVLGEAGVTNTGSSVIYGSVAGSIGTPSVTGFPPGSVIAPGTLYLAGVANSGLGTPFGDALAAYNYAGSLTPIDEGTTSLGAGGLTSLAPGVYSFTSTTVLLSGQLLLDAGGSGTASWTFQIPNALTTADASSIVVVDAGGPGQFGGNITWVVGSAATLGTNSQFVGTLISEAGSVLDGGATIDCGRAISLNASVTLNNNIIGTPSACMVTSSGTVGTPEPGTFLLLAFGLFTIAFRQLRPQKR